MTETGGDERTAEGLTAAFPCEICGREFVPGPENRCEECRRFACRDCLKIHYHLTGPDSAVPTRTLCYNCYHSIYEKPYIE